jgi:hypothetical protein
MFTAKERAGSDNGMSAGVRIFYRGMSAQIDTILTKEPEATIYEG